MDEPGGLSERRTMMTVDRWVTGLVELLGEMIDVRGRVVSVAQFRDGRYIQFWVEPDGVLIAEVISNLYTRGVRALSEDDEHRLREMGWREPRRGPNPNWFVVARGRSALVEVFDLIVQVVDEVLRESRRNVVEVHTWTVERDGASLDDLREESRVHYRSSLERMRLELDGY